MKHSFASLRTAAPGHFLAVGLRRAEKGFSIARKKNLLNLKTAKFAARAWKAQGLSAYVYDDRGEQIKG